MPTDRNPRIGSNNWRVAAILLSRDIRRAGYSIAMKSNDSRTMSDAELQDILFLEPVTTGNDIIDNVIFRFFDTHKVNPNSNKIWRGDIDACYARIKKTIAVCLKMSMVQNPTLFGIDEETWREVASGRGDQLKEVDFNILFEAFKCRTEGDAGYLYQRIKYVIDPTPIEGVVGIPICEFCFAWRRDNGGN